MVKTLNTSNNNQGITIVRRQNEPKRKGTNEIKSLNYRYVFQTPLYPSIL